MSDDSGGNPGTKYFDLGTGAFAELEARKGVAVIADLKRARGVVKSNPGASLVDLGDGVACVEFHSKMNSLGEDNFQMMQVGLEALDSGCYDALVIANQGQDFCVGANLALVLMGAQYYVQDIALGVIIVASVAVSSSFLKRAALSI